MKALPPATREERRAEIIAVIAFTAFLLALIGGAGWIMQ